MDIREFRAGYGFRGRIREFGFGYRSLGVNTGVWVRIRKYGSGYGSFGADTGVSGRIREFAGEYKSIMGRIISRIGEGEWK